MENPGMNLGLDTRPPLSVLQLLELREAQGGAASAASEAPLKPLTQVPLVHGREWW
jgi:hypothetical protein